MSTNNTFEDGHPSNLTDVGPPETRIGTANQARSIFEKMRLADLYRRAPKRALVKGLVDGNPPYRQVDLDNAGRSHQANINFRTAESYLENAVGAFYDTHNEAPTYASIRLKKGTPEQIESGSRAVTTHFDWLCRYEPNFDYNIQISQNEMVLYGRGPLVFQDIFDWRPTALLDCQLRVPERTKSDTSLWECATLEVEYLSDELWKCIRDVKAATALGWNVPRVQQAIINASPESTKSGLYRTWEWHQQQLKNGSLDYSSSNKTISVVHVFCREFARKGEAEGKITHLMIVNSPMDDKPDRFLFQKIGRYDNWNQCIHPMYYDRGGGGFHHSVTGMGTKMYSVFELQNRVLCNAADKAMAPKLFFKPTSSSVAEEFSIVQHADYGVSPEGFDLQQTPMGGFMDEVLGFNREISNLASANLSAYRSNLTEPVRGNPETATKVQLDASKEASLQKTQMNRHYAQKDALYAEMFRRAVNVASKSSPGGERAMEFIARCKADGVSLDMLKEVEYVKASRVVGQGSEFLRQQSTEFLFGTVLPMISEDGRTNLIDDVIASRAGQHAVERYNPKPAPNQLPSDQYAVAMGQVADMKTGVPAVVTASQNPLVFAGVFLQAADQAAGTLEQGANPSEVASFLELDGAAIRKHINRMSADPSRKAIVKQMMGHWEELTKVHDELVQHIQDQQQQQAAQQQQMQQQQTAMQSDFALAKQKQDMELALKAQKTRFGMADKAVKTRQGMVLRDATTAQDIRLKTAQQQHDAMMAQLDAEHNRRMDLMRETNGNGE